MIFFCEDCGKKNYLIPEQFKDGKAVFRCEVCHYLNSYVFKAPKKKYSKKIKNLFEQINPSPEDFKKISKVIGVDQYILIDKKASILIHDIKDPEKVAEKIFICAQKTLGRLQFKYFIFSKKTQKKIFLFVVGNYYLGVIKQRDIDNSVLLKNIINFIKNLV